MATRRQFLKRSANRLALLGGVTLLSARAASLSERPATGSSGNAIPKPAPIKPLRARFTNAKPPTDGATAVPTPVATPTPTSTPSPTPTPSASTAVVNNTPLSTLAANTARVIGPYANPDAQFVSPLSTANITDYSGFTYDPTGKRFCMFGGGHGPSQETDIRVFDPVKLQWSSLYPPTPVSEMAAVTNLDRDKGRYITTNQPTARHSYNLTLVRGRRFYMMTPRGMPDHLNNSFGPEPNGWGGRMCWYDFDTAAWTYGKYGSAYASPPNCPWYFAAAACLDPISRNILVIGANSQAGAGALWLYDPDADSITTGPAINVGASPDFIYFPPNDKFYVLQSDGRVWEISLSRSSFNASTVTQLSVTGTQPASTEGMVCGYAYDSVNRLIGGNVANGIFYAFDPQNRAWASKVMTIEAGSAGMPNMAFHCLDFDPESGCFIFLEGPSNAAAGGARTWAYRYGAASTAPSRVSTGVSDLTLTLDFGNGKLATFSGANAAEQGDFVGEFVHQKCYLARDPAFPDWHAYFRVDADGSGSRIAAPAQGWRDEVVVEYGRSTSGTPVHITTPYTATVTKNGATVYTATIPKHFWYSRWRYQSSERPVVRTPATLKARGWIPNFDTAGMFGGSAAAVDNTWAGPMTQPSRNWPTGPFDPRMANGGDHDEIGLVTEAAASYVLFGAANNLRTLRTEAEWTGNWPIHIRDDATGAPVSCRDLTTAYKSNGGTINNIQSSTDVEYVNVDTSHYYPCANLPWLMTDDPFLLESMQFGLAVRIVLAIGVRQQHALGGLFYPGETRSTAWGLRDLFTMVASCPTSTPSWLRPKSYWQGCLDDNKTFAMQFVNSPARVHRLFKAWTRVDKEETWMSAWLSAVVGIGIQQGARDWADVFAWSIGKQIAQTNGTSGWPRQWPVPYESVPFTNPSLWNSFIQDPIMDASYDSVTPASWSEYWTYYKSGSDGHSDQTGHTVDDANWDGHTLMAPFYDTQGGKYTFAGYSSYFLHLRSALAVAVRRGIPGAQACYDYLHGEMLKTFFQQYKTIGQARFSVDP
jgi:hypothetical protein